jgi:hypothetical protein
MALSFLYPDDGPPPMVPICYRHCVAPRSSVSVAVCSGGACILEPQSSPYHHSFHHGDGIRPTIWTLHPRHREYRRSVSTMRKVSSVEVNGIELTYSVAGKSGLPPVVLLHALAEDSSHWSMVIEALISKYRAFALDLRGHGGSSQPGDYSLELMRSDVLEFLRKLKLEEVTLIGHSLGAAVAYLVAEAEPGRVRQLVLEEPPPPLPAIPPRAVPSKPSVPLPFDWRVLDAITQERNHPDPAWWEDLSVR